MNRFRVAKGSEADFEHVWISLDDVTGFVELHFLKGPEVEDHALDASHSARETMPPLKRGPNCRPCEPRIVGAGDNKLLFLDHAQFEGSRCAKGRDRQGSGEAGSSEERRGRDAIRSVIH